MARSSRFSISFLKLTGACEHMFISVTPGFEHGPGIKRDGITSPRMRDPHSIAFVCQPRQLSHNNDLSDTIDPYIQRAGTWTLYQHLKEFCKRNGDKWRIVGVQSCGDLTMNPWHVAYIRKSYIPGQVKFCGLLGDDEIYEPFENRIYRCIVKWSAEAAALLKRRYEALDLTFHEVPGGYSVIIKDVHHRDGYAGRLSKIKSYDANVHDISSCIDFALAGKPVVESGEELSLANAIDRFQDIRHIFNLPTVKAHGAYQGQPVDSINFGEYQLFHNLNERRAALSSSVIIDLCIKDYIKVEWEELKSKLLERHFKPVLDSPTRRGQFRRYTDDIRKDKVEIFFPHNVYPFGVLGAHNDELVCLASGGLSGRVGNTLEGIGRIMYDFFGCDDAVVLDEGFDTFQIINPYNEKGGFVYSNEQILSKIAFFTRAMIAKEHATTLETTKSYHFKGGMCEWPLNKPLIDEINEDLKKYNDDDYDDILSVRPHRSQMRSVIIFAVENQRQE